MVVSALVQLAIAGPVGILFGLGYGTAIRVGYEQVYPALFGDKALPKDTESILTRLEKFYTTVGGLEAHKFGINQGIKNALKAIDADSELVDLIKKNLNLDSQTITVNLSGISEQTPNLVQSGTSSVLSPPFPSSGILFYVQALAKAASERDVNAYASAVDGIGLSKFNTFKLVRDGYVTVETAGFTVRIEFGLLSLTKQKEYIKIHNVWNEAAIEEAKPQGPQTEGGGLLAGVKPIISRGRKGGRPAGQSQRLEKTKLITQIRAEKVMLAARKRTLKQGRGTQALVSTMEKQLLRTRQLLADLLFRYKF